MDELEEKDVDLDVTEEEEKEDDGIITCPVCGEEVEAGTENCPLCGAPVGTLETNDISGTSIDNSAAIDAMLKSAAMLVEESASLGVGSLDDADEDEEDETASEEEPEEEEEEEDEGDPMEPTANSAMPSELTAEQMDQIKAGGMINLSPPAEEPPAHKKSAKPKASKKKEKNPEPTLYNVDELGNRMPDDPEPEKEKEPRTPPAPKASKKKEKKKGGSPAVITVLAAVVALLLGCTAGFFAKTLFFQDFPVPGCQEFAERAVLSVNSVIENNKELYIAEAYVRDLEDSWQCVFRGYVGQKDGTAENKWFRVKVYKDDPDTVRVYFQLDMEKYNELISSDDQEKQIQASMLMNNQKELERCIGEIESGGIWSTANSTLLNNTLHPYHADEESSEEDKKDKDKDKGKDKEDDKKEEDEGEKKDDK